MPDLGGASVIFEGMNLQRLLLGLLVTVRISVVSVALSGVLGIFLGVALASRNKVLGVIARIYLEAVRIIPVLVWLFVFYFGLTKVLQVHIEGEIIAVLVFTLWGTAEMGDIVRGAVTSLPKHQRESGAAIGLTSAQVYRYVVVPQAVRRLMPAAINLTTRMIKTTSLVMLIGVVEMLKVGQQIIEVSVLTNPTASFWVYAFVFVLYFIVCYPVSVFSRRLERRWQS